MTKSIKNNSLLKNNIQTFIYRENRKKYTWKMYINISIVKL